MLTADALRTAGTLRTADALRTAGTLEVTGTLEVADTYRFLTGTWRIDRTLTDHRLHQSGVFSGTATIEPSRSATAPVAQYRESGELRLGAYRCPASRQLRYARHHDGTVAVTFEDGSPFVTCDLRRGWCERAHQCRDDLYEVSWRVCAYDAIVEEWRVRGPHKDYEARCVLQRVDRSTSRRWG